ncbi:MAG: hypothetical protein AAGE52_17815 [Myxococcota bacterium]
MSGARAALLLLLAGACISRGPNETTPGAREGIVFLLRNHSQETICYVYFSTEENDAWGPDRLEATEVVLPGGGRDWEIPAGTYDVRLQDCNRHDLMTRREVAVSNEGVVLTFRQRE